MIQSPQPSPDKPSLSLKPFGRQTPFQTWSKLHVGHCYNFDMLLYVSKISLICITSITETIHNFLTISLLCIIISSGCWQWISTDTFIRSTFEWIYHSPYALFQQQNDVGYTSIIQGIWDSYLNSLAQYVLSWKNISTQMKQRVSCLTTSDITISVGVTLSDSAHHMNKCQGIKWTWIFKFCITWCTSFSFATNDSLLVWFSFIFTVSSYTVTSPQGIRVFVSEERVWMAVVVSITGSFTPKTKSNIHPQSLWICNIYCN